LNLVPDGATGNDQLTGTIAPAPNTGTVRFVVDGQNIGGVPVSGPNGTATVGLDMPTGTHVVDAVYSGGGHFASSTTSTIFSVAQAPSSLVVAVPVRVGPGATFSLSATLSSDGAPVSGAVVWFAAIGHELCRGTTDAHGKVTCKVDEGASDSLYLAKWGDTATFGGDSTHLPVVAHSPVPHLASRPGGTQGQRATVSFTPSAASPKPTSPGKAGSSAVSPVKPSSTSARALAPGLPANTASGGPQGSSASSEASATGPGRASQGVRRAEGDFGTRAQAGRSARPSGSGYLIVALVAGGVGVLGLVLVAGSWRARRRGRRRLTLISMD